MKGKIIDRLLEFKNYWQSIIKNKSIASVIMYMLLAFLLVFVSLHIYNLHQANTALEQRKDELKTHFETELKTELRTQFASLASAKKYEVRKMNITKYAPLDPAAVEGWDYRGNPEITASGEEVIPGKIAAAGPNIPFGTRIYVEGEGWYTVKDRGGKIGAADIDLAADCKDETRAWGVQQRLVIIEMP